MEKNFKTTSPTFLTASQAAKYLNISTITLKKYINKYNIKTFKTPGGHYRINKKDLDESFVG